MDYNQAKRQQQRVVLDLEELAEGVNDSESAGAIKEIAKELNRVHIGWYE